ncbi:polysaccharide deacetylase family protein [Paenibacillus alginolyticus]|uniref:Polysaccharide deacetylase family protein n=1 Tax=Paenibacillus alginolyticus TaxID=59839 RepID=A0ABT4GMQ8_9BACL|nr:polysaccharide deacetylase family protein [Paenibacillus alginolyticus]MCY9697502.1 polysaccharide deacetylase family protein [Paenibacillus alginolyticus]MEC0141968.1 polysaccharide deacetylase family protein [Paenibacillus alginolyticus]
MSKQNFIKYFCIAFVSLVFCYALLNDKYKTYNGYHYSNRVAVLEYHHIDPTESEFTITPDTFKKHLEALKANHYHVISMKEFVTFLNGKGSVPPDAVVITFDDGYESFYKYAYPALKEQNMTATNFIIVNYLGTNPGTPFLNWDEIQTMKSDGFDFYSHTFNSHDFAADQNGNPISPLTNPIYLKDQNRMETEEEYKQRVKIDLKKADEIIQMKLGNPDKLFCFPHGRYNNTLLDIGDQLGIKYYFTGLDGLNTPGTKLIKRVNVGSAHVTAKSLLRILNGETSVTGNLRIFLKNIIVKQRMSE